AHLPALHRLRRADARDDPPHRPPARRGARPRCPRRAPAGVSHLEGLALVRDARAEALERVDGRYEVRVLEPSPPAVSESPWCADDPVARGDVPPGRQVVSPVTTGDVLWDDLARDDA